MSECCNTSPFYMGVGNKQFENRVIEIVKEQITSNIEKIVKDILDELISSKIKKDYLQNADYNDQNQTLTIIESTNGN